MLDLWSELDGRLEKNYMIMIIERKKRRSLPVVAIAIVGVDGQDLEARLDHGGIES